MKGIINPILIILVLISICLFGVFFVQALESNSKQLIIENLLSALLCLQVCIILAMIVDDEDIFDHTIDFFKSLL